MLLLTADLAAQFEEDPDAYGMKRPLDPPGQELARSLSGASATSVLSAISDVGTADTVSDLGSPRAGPYRKRRRFGPVKQVCACWRSADARCQ